MNKQFRQGDVFLVRVDELPAGVEPIAREKGKIVLAHGEATGHAHTINRCAKFFRAKDGKRFLAVSRATALAHQEHDTITLPAGVYEVRRQREYSPQEIRTVAD